MGELVNLRVALSHFLSVADRRILRLQNCDRVGRVVRNVCKLLIYSHAQRIMVKNVFPKIVIDLFIYEYVKEFSKLKHA